MMLLRPDRGRRAGFTLVELTISTLIMGMMMGFLMLVQVTGQSAADQAGLEDEAEARLTRALERVSNELRSVVDATIWEDLEGLAGASDILTFQALVSLEGGVATTGSVVRLEVEVEPSEVLDDVDNDGDGLVDEGVLYLTRDLGGAGEQRVVLCRGVQEYYTGESLDLVDENGNGLVDEGGFHIERDGDRLIVRLAVEAARTDGSREARSGEAHIWIRN
jgi:type II secretory pathway pseudopilin PulG